MPVAPVRIGQRILLIEDDRGIQGLIKVLFERRGIHVDLAGDGEEALEMLRDESYDVILLDLMLPFVNGFEVVRELRAFRPETLKKTIIITAVSDLTLGDFDQRQVRRVLRKPFSIADLITAVEQCIGTRESLTEDLPSKPPRPEPAILTKAPASKLPRARPRNR